MHVLPGSCAALLTLSTWAFAQLPFDAAAIDDAQARRAWSFLTPDEQADALARFEAEAQYLGTFQGTLVRYARGLEERDVGYLPRAAETPYFDPTKHAPGQPIPRRRLDPDSSAAKKQLERMLGHLPARKLHSGWSYDWGARDVVRTAELDDVERRFANALAGFAPGLDLAEALVERALDGGAHQKQLACFAHAYTDRTGNVFPGLTLYDAWSSGAEMEMPDVDVLGIVHEVLGEWKKWTAPVPEFQHDALYGQVGEMFAAAKRYRGLRAAIAATFVEGWLELRDGYTACLDRFHALWEANASTPAEVAKLLPQADGWSEFLAEWSDKLARDDKLRLAALERRRTLERDALATRAYFLGVLADLDAFERTALPPPKLKPPKQGGK